MPRGRSFSPDEQINMQLRHAAGESIESIADDYECARLTVKRYLSEEYRYRERGRGRPNRRKPPCRPLS